MWYNIWYNIWQHWIAWLGAMIWAQPHTWANWVRYMNWWSTYHWTPTFGHNFPCPALPPWATKVAANGQCITQPAPTPLLP